MTRTRLVVAIWALLLALCITVIARTSFNTDMQAFLPRSPRPAQQILVDQLREGVVSRLVLVSIDNAPEQAPALSRALADRLRGDPRFALVANGDQDALGRERELVWTRRYLLSPSVVEGHFTAEALHLALENDVRLLGSELGMLIKRALPSDPTGEALGLIQSLAGRSRAASRDGVWVTSDGRSALLTVSTRAAGFDIDAQQAAISAVSEAFTAIRDATKGESAARLVLTGPPVFAVQSRDRIKGDAEMFSTIATVLVAGVLLLAYRSAAVLGLALLPVASGALAGVAAVSLAFGFVHGITLGFGVTLIGEAVDYAIYLFTQTQPGESPRATLPRVWRVLVLGMLTSVCGFSAMLFSGFDGFAQLGLFTIVGLVAALAVTRFVLPELLQTGFAGVGSVGFARPLLALMRNGVRLRWGVLALALLAAASIATHRGAYWEDQLSSMSPIAAADLAIDSRLRREIGAPDVRHLLVVQAGTAEAALVASERVAVQLQPLVDQGLITGFDTPARFLPSRAMQERRRAALPEPAVLSDALAQAATGTPFRAESFAPFLADIAAARSAGFLQRADLDGTGLALQVDSLLLHRGSGFAALLPLQGVGDAENIAAAVARFDVPGLVFVDLRRESDALLGTYRSEAITLSLAGSLVIVALLAVALRSPRRIAVVLLPLVAAVLCTAAIDLTISQRLSIFNLFGLLLVVAVGSNYALFFERGWRQPDAQGRRVVASLLLADLCTVIGFGVLGFSAVPVLSGIGATVAIGACLCLAFSAIIGPRAA